MSESEPYFNYDDYASDDLPKFYDSPAATPHYYDHTPTEYSQVFSDAQDVQTLFDIQTYQSNEKLIRSTAHALERLNDVAKSTGLLEENVSMIEAVTSSHKGGEISEGKFCGFAIASIITKSPYDNNKMILRPQLFYQVRSLRDDNLDTSAGEAYHYGNISSSTLVFDSIYDQIDLIANIDDPDEEQITIEQFNMFNDELEGDISASSLHKAETLAFYLLNKSFYAREDTFEDMIIDTASHHIPLNRDYHHIETDFCIDASNVDGKPNYRFIRKDGETIVFQDAPVRTVSCLPRSIVTKDSHGNSSEVIKQNQKALYLTVLYGKKTYHIPFEHVRSIKLNDLDEEF